MINYLRKFLAFLKRSFKTVLLSLGISTLIWFAISLQLFPDITQAVDNITVSVSPTTYMKSNSLELVDIQSFPMTVRAEGKRYVVEKLVADDFNAFVDLSGINTTGRYEVPVVVELKENVDCNITPDVTSTTVEVVRIVTKTLNVEAVTEDIDVIDGFLIDTKNLKASPETVTISGEEKQVNSITKAVATATTDLTLDKSTELGGEIVFYNNGVVVDNPNITLSNDSFTVSVPIHKVKTLPIDFSIINYQSNFDIEGLREKMVIYPTEITISSPDSSIDAFEKLELTQISLSELDSYALRSTRRDTIAPILPDGYNNISGSGHARLTFEGIDDYNDTFFTIPKSNFSIKNLPSGYNVSVLTNELTVTVVGPASFVQSLSVDDITVTINLMGMDLTEGARSLNVNCRINGTKVPAWVAGTPQVDVMISKSE